MFLKEYRQFLAALYLVAALFCIPANAVTVSASASQPTLIGNTVAGKTYRVTASGVADLFAGWNGQGLPFSANGKPTYAFPAPYAPFYPNGLDNDPSSGPTAYGIGGPQKLYGALLGTFSASPQSHSDYFMMGNYHVFTANSSGALYASINDCCFWDNAGSFEVSMVEVQAATVSTAATLPVFIGNVVAGKTYRVMASGVADIGVGWNGQGLPFTANGRPTRPFQAPYSAFYPNGLDYDPASGTTAYGVGGPQKLYGSLIGAFTSSPQVYADFFMIGDDYIFTAGSTGALYAMINDCCYSDNAGGGGYDVSMSEVPNSGGGETIQYSYDAKGRLVKVQRSGGVNNGVITEYAYDKADNRQNVKVTGSSNSPLP
ncbi:hypothetical protein GGC65_000439 [Sphingopyxis sp. OAS728]|uniref:hypothetical protein n=1 Tax=Sphingopyxis sp. OAS728 TaxID=2663823 RepID=UPI0019DDA806|nr:hypothetical protein [Sphingopyxis sp. OAS728]MBE1525983.1 hypothetical protein [Sphingopyxis sp. OAS728]